MKRIILLAILCFSMQFADAQSEKLTNQSVVDMIELGFETDIIISKIQNTKATFDVSIDALKALKEKGISNSIIAEMLKSNGESQTAKVAKTGLFITYDTADVQILPTIFSGSRTNTLAAAFSYGIASAKTKSMIQNTSSANIVGKGKPIFTFFFKPNQDNNFGNGNWWFHTATSPNEFALIVLDVNKRKNCREIEVGSVNMWSGVQTGVKNKKVFDIEVKQVSDGEFIVTPKEDLDNGEYCFYYKGVVPQGGYNNQVAFDFSVQ